MNLGMGTVQDHLAIQGTNMIVSTVTPGADVRPFMARHYASRRHPLLPHHDNNGWNPPLDGWQELTEAEFAQSNAFLYTPIAIGYEQIMLPGEETVVCVTLFFNHDQKSGFGMSLDQRAKRVRYFKFGCDHQHYTGVNLGNCYNRYTCKACGWTWEVDSGD